MTDRTTRTGHRHPQHTTPTRPFPGPFDGAVVPPLPARWSEQPAPEPAGPGLLARFRRRVRIELLAVGALVLLPRLPGAVKGLHNPSSPDDVLHLETWAIATQVGLAVGLIGICIYLLWRDGRLRPAGFGGIAFGRLLGIGLGTALLALGAALVVGMLAVAWHAMSGSAGTLSPMATSGVRMTAGTVTAAVLLSLAAGFSEEIVFRGYAISRFADAGWARAGWWVPLLLWAAMHLWQGPLAVLQVLAMGSIFVLAYAWTRNVWPLVLGHVVLDLAIFGLAFLAA
ncbi:MAG: CPBP family intramembrane metalloprotease [Acidimicrobiia bacterium]|nr:CPBP family intramembrane metalloprotease [Acidimicrobiia bacterium]